MHRAFRFSDVLWSILTQVDSNDTLASLARVSSVISDPALDRLWHTIDSATLLARCMPAQYWIEEALYPGCTSDSLHVSDRPDYARQLVFTERDRVGDWLGGRFRLYAARIHSLSMQCYSDEAPSHLPFSSKCGRRTFVHTEIFLAWLAYSRRVAPLFLNLEHLQWTVYAQDHCRPIAPFLVPSLTSISFDGPFTRVGELGNVILDPLDPTPVIELLEAPSYCPRLHTFDAHNTEVGPTGMSYLETVALSLHQCREFQCLDDVSETFMAKAATSLPSLEVLQLLLRQIPSAFTFVNGFPALKHVTIVQSPMETIRKFITSIRSSSVNTVKIICTSHEITSHQMSRLANTLAVHPSAHALRTLNVTTSYFLGQGPPEIDFNSIRGLLLLQNLRHITLMTRGLEWIPGGIGLMLQSWPHLEYLEVSYNQEMHLCEFVHAARNNFPLEHVPVTAQCTADTDFAALFTGVHLPHLKHIQIEVPWGEASLSDAQMDTLARCLVTSFPVLSTSKWSGCDARLARFLRKHQDRRRATSTAVELGAE